MWITSELFFHYCQQDSSDKNEGLILEFFEVLFQNFKTEPMISCIYSIYEHDFLLSFWMMKGRFAFCLFQFLRPKRLHRFHWSILSKFQLSIGNLVLLIGRHNSRLIDSAVTSYDRKWFNEGFWRNYSAKWRLVCGGLDIFSKSRECSFGKSICDCCLNLNIIFIAVYTCTVTTHNSHTPNSHTLFTLMKMWLFGYANRYGRICCKNRLGFLNIESNYITKIYTIDAKFFNYPNNHNYSKSHTYPISHIFF